jgi:protein SHQ1
VREVFEKSDCHFHFNRLFMDDYCVFIQKLPKKTLKKLRNEVEKICVKKAEVGFPMAELEQQAMDRLINMEVDEESRSELERAPL